MILVIAIIIMGLSISDSFLLPSRSICTTCTHNIKTRLSNSGKGDEEYSNAFTSFLGNFLDRNKQTSSQSIVDINWSMKKRKNMSLNKLAGELERLITKTEWFVTGNVDPSIFSESFSFKDPDVKLTGIKEYAFGVNKLFDQATSRAEVIDVQVIDTKERIITVTWRLEGKVRVGLGIRIKPYIVLTDYKVDKEGLIYFQEDRFSIPGYDILLSAFFPFLIPFLSPPALPISALRKQK
jgi:hypothetical protein